MSNALLTLVFATRNGEHVLPRVLEGYLRAADTAPPWELVVVDNGSTDETALILDRFRTRLPMKVLFQTEAGKNRALNTGIREASGDLVVLTDDDAIPSATFIRSWSKYARSHLEYDLFGASISPLFEAPPPSWLKKHRRGMEMLFAELRLPEGEIGWDSIYGPNMAVRKSVFDAGFRFDENVGPNALDSNYAMGSESEFCRRVAHCGSRCWFAKEPSVAHIVRPFQLQSSYWAKRAYRSGKGRAFMTATDSKRPIIEDSLCGRFGPAMLNWLKSVSPFPQHRFDSLCSRNFNRGLRDGRKSAQR